MQKQNVRPWAYRVWSQRNQSVCVTLATDGAALEKLISEHGELVVMVAWGLFVYGDGYQLEPRELATECTSKAGVKYLATATDASLILRFPLAAFLKVPDGYIFNAKDLIADKDTFQSPHCAVRKALSRAIKPNTPDE